MQKYNQVALIVLDGWGYREDKDNNAIAEADKPFYNQLWGSMPHSLLQASGLAVGLPEGQMGNSEVGHTIIGAGVPVLTDLVRISKSAEEGGFKTNPAMQQLFQNVLEKGTVLHVMGLLSPGGVHSHKEHLYAFLRAAKEVGVTKIAIHAFTDGRDVPPRSAAEDLTELQNFINELGVGFIASVEGRYYAMDRDHNWDRTQKVLDILFESQGERCLDTPPSEAVKKSYETGINDEYIVPTCFEQNGESYKISDGDSVFFFNFRPDRARQITSKILERVEDLHLSFATMCEYEQSFTCPAAFPPVVITTTIGQEVEAAGLTQAHIAETEKYAHATYFLNGGREKPYNHEEDILIASHKDVATHDQAPDMRATPIADAAVEQIEKGTNFIFINFANADMVGHTGKVPAILEAVHAVDINLKRVVEAMQAKGGVVLITADHGNAEENIDPATGEVHTSHTTNPVPFIVVGDPEANPQNGSLADLAPTTLTLLGLEVPEVMTGHCLV